MPKARVRIHRRFPVVRQAAQAVHLVPGKDPRGQRPKNIEKWRHRLWFCTAYDFRAGPSQEVAENIDRSSSDDREFWRPHAGSSPDAVIEKKGPREKRQHDGRENPPLLAEGLRFSPAAGAGVENSAGYRQRDQSPGNDAECHWLEPFVGTKRERPAQCPWEQQHGSQKAD